MTFSEYLNECMIRANCNASELARACSLSQAVISRYRSADRVPSLGSEQLSRIIQALVRLSATGGGEKLSEAELTEHFCEILRDEPGSVFLSADGLNELLAAMNINIKKLSNSISYDPSYLSRIRSGQRRPSNPISFAQGVIRYLMENCDRKDLTETTAQLLHKDPESLDTEEALKSALTDLLIRHWDNIPSSPVLMEGDSSSTLSFIRKLGEFDLNEFIRALHFDTLRTKTVPIRFSSPKTCFGIEEMKQCELDFFRQTVMSRSAEPVYMCSDMDMEDMAQDVEFSKKWMYALAVTIKKGLQLNIIHTLDRPVKEMMLGLESWIPLYMTGQVSSWYLPGTRDRIYSHLHYVSGAAALSGECIRGHHDNSRYYLTNNKKEVAYYRSYCTQLFDRAKPLMAVFTADTMHRYTSFLSSSVSVPGPRRMILSAPPLSTMSRELLDRILERSGEDQYAGRIRQGVAAELRHLDIVMQRERCEIELCTVSREEFEAHPVSLSLSNIFLDHNIFYTWEEYQEHIAQTRAVLEDYPLSTLKLTDRPGFHNIRIHILKGRWAMISRNVSPAIHFVIRHPKLRAAIENLELPVVEETMPDSKPAAADQKPENGPSRSAAQEPENGSSRSTVLPSPG